MRIGILPSLDRNNGGIYQYSVTMLNTLARWNECENGDHFIILLTRSLHSELPHEIGAHWDVESLNLAQPPLARDQVLDVLRRAVGEGPHREMWRRFRHAPPKVSLPDVDRAISRPYVAEQLHGLRVELTVYTYPHALSFETDVPYVMAIHDIQHRLHPEFPEVSADGELEQREYVFRNGARSATMILADSEVGKEDILNFYGPYGVAPERVRVLPYLPASYLVSNIGDGELRRIRTTYQLPERYLFYPAQFWPHKNHLRLVRALALLRDEYHVDVPIVFCGSHSGAIRERTFAEVMSLASHLGLEREVRYAGYVPDGDMSGIYASAAALTMPTFFGPTNIPVIEAWAHGCPVLTSDIRGIREQVADAAILVEPCSVESIAAGLHQLWTDEDLSRTLVERGYRRLREYSPADYDRRLGEIFEDAKMFATEPRRARRRG